MKHINKSIFTLLISSAFLLSCNNNLSKDLKEISDEKAIKISSLILARQSSTTPSLFINPTNYVVISNSTNEVNTNNEKGLNKYTLTSISEFHYDLKNFKTKNYNKTIKTNGTSRSESYNEEYNYYDVSNGVFYTLMNSNGYKTKEVQHDIGYDAALSKMEKLNLYKTDILNKYNLENFSSKIDDMKKGHEFYKDKQDQYYNYYLGSDNDKSLQTKIERKIECIDTSSIELKGYQHDLNSEIMRDDKMSYKYSFTEKNLKSLDSSYYVLSKNTTTNEYKYDKTSINIPNINEYIVAN